MKTFTQHIARLMLIVFCVTLTLSAYGCKNKKQEIEPEVILFSSSFEKDDVKATESTLEAGKLSSVKTTDGADGMKTEVGTGPSSTWNNKYKDVGFTGAKALTVSGVHSGAGQAFCSNVLFSGLNIPVEEKTRLAYVIYPSTLTQDSYDFDYTQMYFCLDIAFTDGTYLSDLGAIDQNGFGMTAQAQGDSDALYTNQWNYIESKLGDVALGKTIDRIIVTYSKNENTKGTDAEFLTFFDDIVIKTAPDIVYEHLSDYVDILRGTNSSSEFSRGVTTPAVTYPHGFNIFTPVTDKGSTLPYSYQLGKSNNTISSLQITHCASFWVGYYATWQFMANTSIDISKGVTSKKLEAESRKAEFTHDNEIAKAHYYSITFDEGSNASGVKMEVTPTMYGAMVRITFPEDSENRNIIFDCENALGKTVYDEETGTFQAFSDDSKNNSRRMYVYGEFLDVKTKNMTFEKGGTSSSILSFDDSVDSVTMKLSTSFISYEQAQKNMEFDMGKRDDFDDIFEKAQKEWDDLLGIVEIEGATFTQLVTYYSCMYRVFGHPYLLTENTGTESEPVMQYASPYSGSLAKPDIKDGALVCSTGLWDTYRTAWPAYSFFNYQGTNGATLIEGLLQHYRDKGWNGQWMAYSGFQCMIGTHSDVIYADAAIKGIEFDYQTAFDSMVKNASVDRGNDGGVGRTENHTSVFTGYVTNKDSRGLSWTQDNCINDYGIYRMAEKLGLKDEAEYYKNRALSYVTVFSEDDQFYIGKDANGKWSATGRGFNPENWSGDYCESNAWNQAFSMVHDVQGMINLYGGRDNFNAKLDTFFSTPVTNVNNNSIHEVREMRDVRLGQYEHSNQIAHHICYMYDYSGQPWKTQEKVRSVLARCYVGSEIGQGYVGDEDNGEQSGWYVFSALGFYPMNLASGEYAIGSPLFPKVTIHLPTGDITITANNNNTQNIYIQGCTVNGQSYDNAYFTQELFSSGNVDIVFEMGATPTTWASSEASAPSSLSPSGSAVNYKADKLTASGASVNNVTNLSALFDNNSRTSATSNGNVSVVANLGAPTAVSMLTITSADGGKDNAPNAFTLYGSNDGVNWVQLDSRSGIEFKWDKYTRPFSIPEANRNAYQYYKIDLSGNGNLSIAELELIG